MLVLLPCSHAILYDMCMLAWASYSRKINLRIIWIYTVVCYRIALQEETNRMSANALAIVFAPCILRCPDTIDPLQSVQDISKTTAYVHWPVTHINAVKQQIELVPIFLSIGCRPRYFLLATSFLTGWFKCWPSKQETLILWHYQY